MIPFLTLSLLATVASADPGTLPNHEGTDAPTTADRGEPSPAARPSPPTHVPMPVDAVRWAQPFSLAEEMTWTMAREPRALRTGWLVEVAAPAELLQPRAVGQQVLFANDTPVRALHTPLMARCSVVVVPGDRFPTDADLSAVTWFFGSTELPERMDPDHGAWEQKLAQEAGIPPIAPDTTAPPTTYDDLTALAEAAERRFEACRAAAPGLDSTR